MPVPTADGADEQTLTILKEKKKGTPKKEIKISMKTKEERRWKRLVQRNPVRNQSVDLENDWHLEIHEQHSLKTR